MSGKKPEGYDRAPRLELVDRECGELPLSAQARLLGPNRSGLYYRPSGQTADE